MTRTLALLPLFLTVACGPSSEPLLFFLNDLPPLEIKEQSRECDENFDNAQCPEADEVDLGDWTITDTYDASNPQAFLEIYELGPDNKAIVVFQGDTIEGEKTGNGSSFTFLGRREAFAEDRHTEDNSEGYVYETYNSDRTIVDLALNVEKGVLTADIQVSSQSVATISETDEWDEEDTEVFGSRVGFCAALEPDDDNRDCTNSSEDAECSDDECEYTITNKSIARGQFFGYHLDDAPQYMTVEAGQAGNEAGFGVYSTAR